MHDKHIEFNVNKIFQKILFVLMFIVLFFSVIVRTELKADAENKKNEITISSTLNHINILRDGRVEAVLQFDLKAKKIVDVVNLSIPYQKNQSVTINDIRLAEVNNSSPALEYIKATQVSELQKNQINSYTSSDLGDKISIKLKTSIPESTAKRVRISYTINSASQRFNDAALTELTLFDENREITTNGYALIVSFDSIIFPEEINKYNLYEHNSLDGLDKLLRPTFSSEILDIFKLDKSEIINIPSDAYISFSSFIPENTRVDVRLLYPSDWLAIDSYLIWTAIYTLVNKGFLTLNKERLYRKEEQLLPDENQLHYYERMFLHWIWNLMDGHDSISIEKLTYTIQNNLTKNMEKLTSFQKALELYCIENGYLLAESKIKIKKTHLVVALVYIFSAIIISIVSNFFVPTWLLVPGGIFLLMALKQNRYTDLGNQILSEAASYKKYLRNVDRYNKSVYSKDKFAEDFIYSIALQCNDRYLQSLKYLVPMSTVVQNRYLSSLGFNEIETNVYKEISKQKHDLPVKKQKEIYNDISDLVEKRLLDIQHILSKLELHRVLPKNVEIEQESNDNLRK